MKISEADIFILLGILIISLIVLPHGPPQASGQISTDKTVVNFGGDWGCHKSAVNNVKLISDKKEPIFGAGDYGYGCDENTLKSMWDPIPKNYRVGVPGNHECEKGQNTGWAAATFAFVDCKVNGQSYKIGHVGIIGINDYSNYKVDSKQYNKVLTASAKFAADPNIYWIVYVFHEPTHGLGCTGGHCHKDKTDFAKIYDPIIKKYGGLVVEAHTHLTGFGLIDGIAYAQCAGGGQGGTALNGLKGFAYGSSSMGYCHATFDKNRALFEHISSNGPKLGDHLFTK